jgi:hypothetical protein
LNGRQRDGFYPGRPVDEYPLTLLEVSAIGSVRRKHGKRKMPSWPAYRMLMLALFLAVQIAALQPHQPAWAHEDGTLPNSGYFFCDSKTSHMPRKQMGGVAIFWVLRLFPGSSVTEARNITPKNPYEPFDVRWRRRILVHFFKTESELTSKILTIDQCGNLNGIEDIESDL